VAIRADTIIIFLPKAVIFFQTHSRQ
jgi:hypothetical protein